MSEELEIEIDASGKVTMQTRGIQGPPCMDWADLLAAIVGREESRQKTREYHQTAQSENRSHHALRQLRL